MITVDISKGIKVGGFDYQVKMDKETHRMVQANNNFGECDCRNHTISICNDLDEQVTNKVFLHEVIEAINNVYCDNGIPHDKIQQLSFGLHQVMNSLGVTFKNGE